MRIASLILIAGFMSCRQTPTPVRAEEVTRAIHEHLPVGHEVIDSILRDRDGAELLAERLARDPTATRQLLERIAKKEQGDAIIRQFCASRGVK